MWTYVARRLLYAIPILIGVLFLTFILFFAISSPEDLARAQLQKGANDDSIARWMRDQGYATYNEQGLAKLKRAPELQTLSKQQSDKGEEARQFESRAEAPAKVAAELESAFPAAKAKTVVAALTAMGTHAESKEAAEKLKKVDSFTSATLEPVLTPLKTALASLSPSTPQSEGAVKAIGELEATLPTPALEAFLKSLEELPESKALAAAEAAAAEAAKPYEAKDAEAKAALDALGAKIKAASGDKDKGIKPDAVEVKRLTIDLQRTKERFAKEKAPLANIQTEGELKAQAAALVAGRAKLAAMKAAQGQFTKDDGTLDPLFNAQLQFMIARFDPQPEAGASLAELELSAAQASHDAHLLQEQVHDLIVGAEDTQRHGIIRMFVTYVTDLFTFNFGDNNVKRPVGEVLRNGMGPSLKLMIPAFLLTEFIAVTLALFAALYRGTRIDRSLVVLSVFLMSFSAIAMTMFLQKVLASDWGYFPIAGYTTGLPGYAFLLLPMMIYVIISLGSQVRFNRILMLDEIGQDYVRTAKAKGLGQNTILFKHVLRNTLIPLITRWAVIIPNLYLGSLVLESFFGIPGLGGITVQAIANRDVNTIRALVFIGTIIYILATLLADVLYAVVDPRVKLK